MHLTKVPVKVRLNPVKAVLKVILRSVRDLALSARFLTVLPLPAWAGAAERSADGQNAGDARSDDARSGDARSGDAHTGSANPARAQVDGRRMAQAAWTFPLVGLLLGAILAAANWLMTRALPTGAVLPFGAMPLSGGVPPSGAMTPAGGLLPSSAADLLTVGVLIILTGGLHVDGLADTCDGFFSRRPRERILEIMRDSRVGSFGVIGIVLDLMARFVLLNSLGPAKLPALILVPVLSRWVMVLAARIHPYARAGEGLGKAFTEYIGAREVALASITALLLAVALLRGTGLIVAGVVLLLALGASRWIAHRIGGMTGDTFGAINEVAEIGGLLALVLLRA